MHRYYRLRTRCHRDACFPGYCVFRTHIPRDACVPAHISLTHLCLQVIVIYVSPGILFPRLCCEVAIAIAELHGTRAGMTMM